MGRQLLAAANIPLGRRVVGQLLEDVQRLVRGRVPVAFLGRMGGAIPLPDEILPALDKLFADLPARNRARGPRVHARL